MILPTQDELYVAKVYRRATNGNTYDENPYATFKCRIATNMEVKSYRLYKGVQGSQESMFIYASNLPKEIKTEDRIEVLGQSKIIKSIGYYFDDSVIINPSLFSPRHIFESSPKGLSLS